MPLIPEAAVPTATRDQAALIVFLIRLTELYNRIDEQKGATAATAGG
jgi:hypothetical protein